MSTTETRLPERGPRRPLRDGRAARSTLLRLRDLALLPALALAGHHRLVRQPGLPDPGQHHHHPDLVGGAGAGRAGRVADRHHRQVRPVAGIDRRASRRRSAPWWSCRPPVSASALNCRPSSGMLVVLVVGVAGRLRQRLHGRAPQAQRLHRHARDADHPARHAGRRDQRADAVRPAGRVLRADGHHLPRPAARGLAGGARLRGRRLHAALSPPRPRALRDRRQSRRRRARPASASSASPGASTCSPACSPPSAAW